MEEVEFGSMVLGGKGRADCLSNKQTLAGEDAECLQSCVRDILVRYPTCNTRATQDNLFGPLDLSTTDNG